MGALLTLREVGLMLKLEPETVRRAWIVTGKLPATRVGHQWRVDSDDIPAALELINRERDARREKARQQRLKAIAVIDMDAAMTPGGLCTSFSEKDQHQRDTRGQPWTPPDIPE